MCTTIVDFGIAGHGWTANTNAASSSLNDTTAYARGTQSAKLTTKADGTVAALRNTAMSSVNLTGKRIEVSVMVDDWTHAASILLYIGDAGFTNFRVLTLWLASDASANGASIKPAANGEWVTFTADLSSVTSTTGAPNIAAVTAMQIAIVDDGTAAVTMHANHIAHFPASTVYPNGVVSFSFDDSFLNQYTVARPKLDQYNWKGTFYTIVDLLGQASYMTQTQLLTMQDVAGHDIGAHAYYVASHNTAGGFTGMTAAALDAELRSLKNWLVTIGARSKDHFAYPQGLWNPAVERAVRSYFSSARATLSYPKETWNPSNVTRLRTFRCNTNNTLAQAKAAVDAAYTNGTWLIYTVHDLPVSVPSGSGLVEWAAQDFRDLVDYVAGKGIPVLPVADVLATAA